MENTREIILDILLAVTRDGEFSHIVLKDVLDKYRYLPKQDRSFITRVSQGTLERMIELDYIINQFSKTKVNKMKPVIRCIIRSGVYQLKYMDSVPASAACNEAVKLAVKRGFSGLKGFVNGVMRNISRNLDTIVYPDPVKEPVRSMSVRYSMPEWIVERWNRQFGPEECEQILAGFLRPRTTTIRVNTSRISVDQLKEVLTQQGIHVTDDPLLDYALHISGYDMLEDIPAFEEGLFYVQDTASMLVTETADPQPGSMVVDVCAAPGGKSIHMAQRLNGTGHVQAQDLTEYKVDLIQDNIERCQVANMSARVWDALEEDPQLKEKADIVIADLPCSGLGVIGTKNDIKFNASEQKIKELSSMQRQMLDVVCGYVKPGGVLMYSTCTITAEENQSNVEWFLQNHTEYKLEQMRQLLPYEGCDGFFIARMVKAAE